MGDVAIILICTGTGIIAGFITGYCIGRDDRR